MLKIYYKLSLTVIIIFLQNKYCSQSENLNDLKDLKILWLDPRYRNKTEGNSFRPRQNDIRTKESIKIIVPLLSKTKI